MLTDIKYPETLDYSSDSDFLPVEFYLSTIPYCESIDLKLGYFSSNAIRALAYGFAQFIFNGGKLRIITNHFLSKSDRNIILKDPQENYNKQEIEKYLYEDLEGLADIIHNGDQHFFDCLKYLHNHHRLIIQPVKLKPNGLSHYKQGLLSDGTHTIFFNGSCNFTYKGLLENGESLSISRSWGEASEAAKINEQVQNFDSIFSKQNNYFEYLSIDDVIEVIKQKGQDKNLEELVDEEIDVLSKIQLHNKLRKSFENQLKKFKKKIYEQRMTPRFPYSNGPRDYQNEAYRNWRDNHYKGIFAMATGTGKTITALNCLLETYKKNNNYRAVILVPTLSLVRQWKREALGFNMRNVITISSKDIWESEVSAILLGCKLKSSHSFILVTTYATFHRAKFQSYFNELPTDTIIIADEVHNMGSPKILATIKKIKLIRRIGLSATPERIYDDWGNKQIRDFFSDEPPYIVNYSMEQAIANKVLCQYYYYPHVVYLNEIELNEYSKISKKLTPFFDTSIGKYKDDPVVEILLLKRKRIIHKAESKLNRFRKIVQDRYDDHGSLKFSLVYVPEGIEPNYDETDLSVENEEDSRLIDQYTRVISSVSPEVTISQFTGETKNRDQILNGFSQGRIHVLSSMKCLDEGVDVPRTEVAFFCSSTGNPRQFIQRRGRILRTHSEKDFAVIHDLVVVPRLYNNADISYDMERNLVIKEMERVVNFAFLAINKYDTFSEMEAILKHYEISLFEIEEKIKSK